MLCAIAGRMSEQMQWENEGRSAQRSEQRERSTGEHVTVRGAGISIGSVRESVGSWSNSHRFIPLKQKVCLRSVAYDTNSGSSSPLVSVTCPRPRPTMRSAVKSIIALAIVSQGYGMRELV